MSVAQCRNAVTWEEKFFACPVLALCQSRGWSVALHGALQQKAMRHDPVQGKHVPDHVFDGVLHASQHPPPFANAIWQGPISLAGRFGNRQTGRHRNTSLADGM